MEWLIGIALAGAAIWLTLKWFAFSHFKSELMNGFGREGIDYATADTIYAVHSKLINTLYGRGLKADAIVRLIVDNRAESIDPLNVKTQSAEQHPLEQDIANQTSSGDAPVGEEVNQTILSLVKFVVGLLTTQSMLMRGADGEILSGAIDDWLIGYVHGQYDAALQQKRVPVDAVATSGLSAVFEAVFGAQRGAVIADRHEQLCSLQPAEFVEGATAGGQDLYNFLKDSTNQPMAWMARYHND